MSGRREALRRDAPQRAATRTYMRTYGSRAASWNPAIGQCARGGYVETVPLSVDQAGNHAGMVHARPFARPAHVQCALSNLVTDGSGRCRILISRSEPQGMPSVEAFRG